MEPFATEIFIIVGASLTIGLMFIRTVLELLTNMEEEQAHVSESKNRRVTLQRSLPKNLYLRS